MTVEKEKTMTKTKAIKMKMRNDEQLGLYLAHNLLLKSSREAGWLQTSNWSSEQFDRLYFWMTHFSFDTTVNLSQHYNIEANLRSSARSHE